MLAAIYASSLTAIALAVGLTIEHLINIQNVLLVFLPVVLFAAVRYGFWMASWVSLLSVLGTSFLLAEPRLSFAVSNVGHVWALAIFILTAAFTSSLAAQARQRAAAAAYHGRVVEQLYAFSSRLAAISDPGELADEIVRQMASILHANVLLLLRDRATFHIYAGDAEPPVLDTSETAAAEASWTERRPTGAGTGRFEEISWRFWPLETAHGVVGLIGRRLAANELASDDEPRLLEALSDQAAVNLERTRLVAEKRENEVLAETEKLRSALLTSISHDLRTPLASILGNVTSLRQYGHLYDDETRAEMLELAEVETLRLARFVDNLLHMTRIDAGALRPTFEMVDLSDVVGSSLKRLDKTLSQHNVSVDVASDAPMVKIDFMLLEHVLANLLDNAAKYAPPGSTIELLVRSGDDVVELRVCDEGPGISEADTTRVFERFFRVRVADHRPAGVGLGLAICKGFVEAMGGRISVANRSDRSGAIFTVVLPLQQPETQAS